MKVLIITADDLGYSTERNRGIIECYQHALISHTSLMVNASAVQHGVRVAKEQHIPMGLHFNISEGMPVLKNSSSSLIGKNGEFLGKSQFWEAASCGQLEMQDVKAELKAQINLFRSLVGHSPFHIDGHQHVHVAKGVNEAFAEVLYEHGVTSTRLPADVVMETECRGQDRTVNFLQHVVQRGHDSAHIFRKFGLKFSDSFIGLTTMGADMTIDKVKAAIHQAFSQGGGNYVCEWMVHPGYRTGNEGGCGSGPDEFSQSRDREHEMNVLANKTLSEFLKHENINITGFDKCW